MKKTLKKAKKPLKKAKKECLIGSEQLITVSDPFPYFLITSLFTIH